MRYTTFFIKPHQKCLGYVSRNKKFMLNFLIYVLSLTYSIQPTVTNAQSSPSFTVARQATSSDKSASGATLNGYSVAHATLPLYTKLTLVHSTLRDTLVATVNQRLAQDTQVDLHISDDIANRWRITDKANVFITNVHLPSAQSEKSEKSEKNASSDRLISASKKKTETTYAAGTVFQSGVASYYGPGFHGRRTANGERFNQFAMTAAHRTLPMGTRVKVTNTRNGRSVVVRINDRGPFAHGRVIDLSTASARAIGISGVGRVQLARITGETTREVEVEVEEPETTEIQTNSYTLQLYSGLTPQTAHLESKRIAGSWVESDNHGTSSVHRVLYGRFNSAEEALTTLKVLQSVGFSGFVRTI